MKPIQSYIQYLQAISQGVEITLKLTLYSAAIALVISIIAGLARLSKFRIIRWITAIYVEFFRGSSLLIQLFWVYFVLSMLFDIRINAMVAGVSAIALNYGAYGSEVVRGSIQSVSKGQTEAAIALNFTPFMRMKQIIFPQAFVLMLPSLGNLLIELLKATALVSLITLHEPTYYAKLLVTANLKDALPIFSLLLIVYFVMAYPLTLIMRWIERRLTSGRYS